MGSPQPMATDVIDRYRRLESALIYDVLDSISLPHQQLSLAIQPLDVNMVVAGPAFTSKSVVSDGAAHEAVFAGRPGAYEMLDALYPGCILVEDVGNDPVSSGLVNRVTRVDTGAVTPVVSLARWRANQAAGVGAEPARF